jgi:hypothetical protein
MSSAEVIERKSRTFWRRQRDAREFLPAALEILETPASPAGRMVALTIILFFAIAIGWAIFGHLGHHRDRHRQGGADRPHQDNPAAGNRHCLGDPCT